VGRAAPEAAKVAIGTDGYVCLAAGEEGFSIPIDNPLGYALTIESSFTQTITIGGEISGVTVEEAEGGLTVHIPNGNTGGTREPSA
jgi:hypothetical protein